MAAARRSRAAANAAKGPRATAGFSLTADSCGCALGARVLIVVLIASSLWYFWLGAQRDRSFTSAAFRVFGATIVGGFVGKLAGIALYWHSKIAERRRAARRSDRAVPGN
jgi:hypothetical protein